MIYKHTPIVFFLILFLGIYYSIFIFVLLIFSSVSITIFIFSLVYWLCQKVLKKPFGKLEALHYGKEESKEEASEEN